MGLIKQIHKIIWNFLLIVLDKRSYNSLYVTDDYDEEINPSVSNAFATAALRFVKSLVDDKLKLYGENRHVNQVLKLREHFNDPLVVEKSGYLDGFIRGLATQSSQKLDLAFAKDVSNQIPKENLYLQQFDYR